MTPRIDVSGTGASASVTSDLPAERNMRVNTISLIGSNLLTGLLGLLFWGAAARFYPAREVGLAAALLTSATMLSTLSLLSIDTLYERFLPLAGIRTEGLLKRGFLLVAGMALLAGCGLLVFGPRDHLFHDGWMMAAFPVLVMVLAMFALQDKATVGLGVARWAAAKNSVHAVAKFAVLLALIGTDSAVSIVLAWGATAAVGAVVVIVAMRRRYQSNPQFQELPNLPPRQQLWSYFGSSFGLTAAWAIGPLVVPLIIVSHFGAEANAHFAVTWAIVGALYFTVHLVVSPYVAEVAANPDRIASLSKRMVQMMVAVIVAGGLGLIVVGPLVLSAVGADYRTEGQGLLHLAALFVPLSAVGAIYEGFARVQRRMRLMIAVRCLSTVIIVVGSVIGVRSMGVTGVGWAYLVAESMSAIVLIVPVGLWLRRLGREHGGASSTGVVDPSGFDMPGSARAISLG